MKTRRIRSPDRGIRILVWTSMILIVILSSVGWFNRHELHELMFRQGELLLSLVLGLLISWMILIACVTYEGGMQRRYWRRRVKRRADLSHVTWPSPLRHWVEALPDVFEWLLGPLLRSPPGQTLTRMWRDAGLGEKSSRFILLLILAFCLGWILGARVGGPVLALSLALLAMIGPIQIVKNRAAVQRRQFVDQLPQVLDSLASGLVAGLSFDQAATFASQELPPPSAEAMLRLSHRLTLGLSLQTSLEMLAKEHPEESLGLVIESILLQRRYGGDLIQVLEDTAQVIRERVELEREVRSVTVQGRLSGYVLVALVPVSAGFLLVFNPTYIELLFDTVIGQITLVIALLLQLVGWAIISRLVRIRY